MPTSASDVSIGGFALPHSVTSRICYRAKRLRMKFGLSAEDEKDLRQDLWVSIVRAVSYYDPSRTPMQRYVTMVLNTRYKHHVRQFMIATEVSPIRVISIESEIQMVALSITDESATTTLERSDLAHDVELILQSLSLEEQQICQAVMECHNPHEAAKRLGIIPSVIYRLLKRLRRIFSSKGVNF